MIVIDFVRGAKDQITPHNLRTALRIKQFFKDIQIARNLALGKPIYRLCLLEQVCTLCFKVYPDIVFYRRFGTAICDKAKNQSRDNYQTHTNQGNFPTNGRIVKPFHKSVHMYHRISQK